MQIHNTAEGKFSKTRVEEFWRLVEGIKWESGRSAAAIKMDLMKIIGPTAAISNKRIALFYALNLVNEFTRWVQQEEITEKYDLVCVEIAAGNVIGGGKYNYEQYLQNPKYLVSELENISLDDNFIKSLPTDDDYYNI